MVLKIVVTVLALALSGSCSCSVGQKDSSPVRALSPSGYQFDGWGTSLAWWANAIGQDSGHAGNDQWSEDRKAVLSALFDDPSRPSSQAQRLSSTGPVYPLGLNVMRYNIGASPAGSLDALPSDCRSFNTANYKAIPTPEQSPDAPVDLTKDPRQIDILQQAIQRIDAANLPGESLHLEAFANSPPWWMLAGDNCPAGQTNSLGTGQEALDISGSNASGAQRYARYLVDILNAFHNQGINFNTLEPFNEPHAGWWGQCRGGNAVASKPYPCQEGANFSPESQEKILTALCQLRDYAGQVDVSANDGNTPDETLDALKSENVLTKNTCVRQVNTHGYSGTAPYNGNTRPVLADLAASRGTRLWMSEFGTGPCDNGGQGCSGLTLAKQISDDLQDLHPAVWTYWQAVEQKNAWGLVENSADNLPDHGNLSLTSRFLVLAQFSRYIRGGSIIYPLQQDALNSPSSDAVRIVVARNTSGQVVVVATNPGTSARPQPLAVHLNPLISGGTATAHRLSFTNDQAQAADQNTSSPVPLQGDLLTDALPAQSVTTYVLDAASPPVAAPPQISTAGAVGPFRFGSSTAADVQAGVGTPEATTNGSFQVPGLPDYRALGYKCSTVQNPGTRSLSYNPTPPYCQTVYYFNDNTGKLEAFATSSPLFQTVSGTKVGMSAAEAQSREKRSVMMGCHQGIILGDQSTPSTVLVSTAGPNDSGVSTERVVALEAETNSRTVGGPPGVGLLFC